MGKAHSLALASQAAKVAVTDIDLAECQLVVDEIKAKGGEAIPLKMDVTDKSQVNEVFDRVIKEYGRLDILVNNAGIFDNTATVRNKDKDNKNKPTDFYFRYEKHITERKDEDTGFYYSIEYPLWGTTIEDLKGADFWNAIRCIINWVPVLVEIIDNRNNSRDQLLSLVNVDQL